MNYKNLISRLSIALCIVVLTCYNSARAQTAATGYSVTNLNIGGGTAGQVRAINFDPDQPSKLFYSIASTQGVMYEVELTTSVKTQRNNSWASSQGEIFPYVGTDIEYDEASGYAYMNSNGRIIRISFDSPWSSNTLINSFTGGIGYESGMAVDDTYIYTSGGTGNNLFYRLNKTTGAVVSSHAQPANSGREGIEYNEATNKKYLLVRNNGFYEFTSGNTFSAEIGATTPPCARFAIDPIGENIYFFSNASTVQRLNIQSGAVTNLVTSIPSGSTEGELEFGPSSDGTGSSLYIGTNNAIFEVEGNFGCTLPVLPTPFVITQSSRQSTLTNVNVAGTGTNVAFVSPGESVSLSFNYAITQNGGFCPGCIFQRYVGIYGDWSSCYRNSGGYCNCSGFHSTTFTAPTTPGVYYITHGSSLQFSCSPTPTRPQNNDNGLAAIVVRETYSTSIVDETCVGDNDGSVTVSPDNGATGNSYTWSTGSTSASITSLSPGEYSVTSQDSYGCIQVDSVEVKTDTIPPVVIGKTNYTVYLDPSGSATLYPSDIDSISSDACGVSLSIVEASLNGLEQDYSWIGNLNGHSYYRSKSIDNFTNVSADAATIGGYVSSITTLEEDEFVFDRTNGIEHFIGLNDQAIEGTYVWANGEPFVYDNWVPGEPNNFLGAEDCSAINYLGNFGWNDYPCGNSYRALIESNSIVDTADSLVFNCNDTGTYSIVLYGHDPGDLDGIDTVTVNVLDTSAPNVSAVSATVYINNSGSYTMDEADFGVTRTDNCGIDSAWSTMSAAVYCADTASALSITFYARDPSGNIDSAVVTATVQDTTSPALITNPVDLYLDSNGLAVLSDSSSTELLGTLYFTSTIANRIYEADIEDAGAGSPTQLYAAAASAATGPVGIQYVEENDSLYYGGGNNQEVWVASASGSSKRQLPNTTTHGNEHHDVSVDFDNSRIFYTAGENGVYVANLDGTGITTQLYNPPGNGPIGIEYDPNTSRVYMGQISLNEIGYINDDGSGYTVLYNNVDGVNGPRQIAIDPINEMIYWANRGANNIMAGRMDGTSSWVLYAGQNGNYGIDVHEESGNVIWTRFIGATDYIMRGDVDGISGPDTLFSGNYGGIRGVSVDALETKGVTYSDNCAISSISIDADSFYCDDIGANLVTVTITDSSGNVSQDTLTATVLDTIVPLAVAKNLSGYFDSFGNVTISADSADSASYDNCVMELTLSDSSFTCADSGDTNVWFYVSDPTGNIDSQMITLTLSDTTRPIVVAQNLNVMLDSFGQAVITPAMVDNGTTDNCAINNLSIDINTFDCSDAGSIVQVVLTATDVSANTDTAHALVTVADTTSPHVITQNLTLALDSFGSATITTNQINNGSWDSCGIDSIYLDIDSFDCSNVGTNTVTLFVDDVNGNTGSNSATVTILDSIAPEVITNNFTAYLDANGTYTLDPLEIDSGSWDSCGIASYTLDIVSFDCGDVGTPVTVSLTVTDNNGNSNTGTAVVTTLDTVRPTVATQNITAYLGSNGEISITPNDVNYNSYDSCGIDTLYLDSFNFSCLNVGTPVTVTLFATDVNGNSDSATAIVTVEDTVSPTVVALPITVHLDSSGNVNVDGIALDNGSWDSCGIDTFYLSQSSFSCADTGVNSVTLFADDINGNTGSVVTTITVLDTIAPQLELISTNAYLDSTGVIVITPALIDNGTWDSCGIASLSVTPTTFNCSNQSDSFYITFTAIDFSNNSSVDSVLIYVFDTIAPEVITQNLTLALDSFGFASILPAQVDNGTWDSCGVDSIYLDIDLFNCGDVGTNTVLLFADDINGNTSSSPATITILDTIAPHVITNDITIALDSFGQYTLDPLEIDSGSWDSCGIATYSLDITNLNCGDVNNPVGVQLTVTDNNGNSSMLGATVTVEDTLAPTIVIQPITVLLDSTGSVSITTAQINNGTWDSCGIDTLYLSQYDFDCAQSGPNTITFYAEDIHGNEDSALVVVTVLELFPPTVIPNDTLVYLDSLGMASVTAIEIDSASYDSCGIDTMWLSNYDFNCGNVGSNIVTLFVQDLSGNIDSADAIVTIADSTAPTLILKDLTVELDSFGAISIDSNALDSATWDSCGIDNFTIDSSSFECANVGSPVTITTTVTDVNGNISIGTSILTVVDNIGPEPIGRDLTVYLDSFGMASITAAQVDSASWDSCGIDTIYLNQYDFDCSHVGANTVTLSVEDVNGNLSTTNVTVMVLDTIAPEVITQSINIYLDASGSYTLNAAEVNNGSWDSCGIATYTLDTSNFICDDIGTFDVILTVEDVNGNSNSAIASVTLADTTSPEVHLQNITVYLDTGGSVSITAAMIDSASSDNCTVDTIFLDEYDFDCADTASQIVTLTVIDSSGNQSTDVATVTILDTIRPIVMTQNLIRYLDANGQITITPLEVDNGSTDNCDIDSLWLSDTLFDCDDTASVLTITLFIKDVSGNVNSNTATIQVFDTLPPVVVAQDVVLYLDSTGNASLTPAQMDNNSTDNCGIDVRSISQSEFNCGDVGDTIIVYLTMTDVSGNTAFDSAQIIPQDTTAPKVLTQNITIYLDSSGTDTITPGMINNNSWDSCGIDTMYLDQYGFNCNDIGTNTVTLTVEDINGNAHTNTAEVTVIDTIAPTIVLQSIPIYLDSFGMATIQADTMDAGTWDSCGVASISIDSTDFTCVSHGDTITIVFTAQDVNGNLSTDSSEVYILDTLPPVVLALSDTVYLDTGGQFIVDYTTLNNGTNDNCAVGEMHLSDSTFDCAGVDSTHQIWYVASDSFGNADSAEIFITVLDTINPEIVCLDTIIVVNDTGECGAIVSFTGPSATDNCSIDSIINIEPNGLDSGSFFAVGITEVDYVAIDQSGNTDTCTLVIEVIDTEKPQLLCWADTAICDSTFEFAIPDYIDNCGGFEVQQIAGIDSGDFYPVGVTVNTFTVMDSYGNSDTCSFEVLRYDFPSIANAGSDQDLCEATSASLSGNQPAVGIGNWSLSSDTAIIGDTADANSSVTGLTLGETSLIWTISNGVCPVERDTIVIRNFSNAAEVNAGADVIVCDSSGAQLQAMEANVGLGFWSHDNNGVILSDSSITNPTVSGLSIGQYEFTWTIENGVCPFSPDKVTVFVEPNPIVSASEDKYIFPPTQIEISATSNIEAAFEWFPKEDILDDESATALVNPLVSMEYTVIGTTTSGCTDVDTVQVIVNPDLEIPTAFTPDGDNTNDVWNIKELANYPDCKVSIFNRWGDKMYESDGYKTPWDGTFRGEPLVGGAYFFVIDLGTGDIIPITGSITIIR